MNKSTPGPWHLRGTEKIGGVETDLWRVRFQGNCTRFLKFGVKRGSFVNS